MTSTDGGLFIISGPSGSGKTSVVEHLLKALPELMFSVSYTTRAPRAGEQDGREYRFVSREAFERMILRGEFLEYASVFGDLYGTHQSALSEAARLGKDLVLDIDVHGARQVKTHRPEAVAILILPPSGEELERRLRARGLDTPEIVQRRLERARMEIESYHIYDYVVINRRLEETCAQVDAVIVAERHQRTGAGIASPAVEEAQRRAAAARKEATLGQVSAILETFGARAQ